MEFVLQSFLKPHTFLHAYFCVHAVCVFWHFPLLNVLKKLVRINFSPWQMFTKRVCFFLRVRRASGACSLHRSWRSWLFCITASCLQLQRVKAFNLYTSSSHFSQGIIYAHKTLYVYTCYDILTTAQSYCFVNEVPSCRISIYCSFENVFTSVLCYMITRILSSFLSVIITFYSPEWLLNAGKATTLLKRCQCGKKGSAWSR